MQISITTYKKNRDEWIEAKLQFKLSLDEVENINNSFRDLKYLKFGNKPGKLLTYLTKEAYNPINIPMIKMKTKGVTNDPRFINKTFAQFYKHLYTPQKEGTTEAKAFLSSVAIPTITKDQMDTLNALISTQDILEVIKSLSKGKAPGSDGFNSDYYKLFATEMAEPLKHLYSEVINGGKYFHTGKRGLHKSHPKEGHDPESPSSYRPISLINIDA